MTESPNRRDLLEQLLPLARAAGDVILEAHRTDFDFRGTSDASPVTAADERAEALILRALVTLTPDVTIIAEKAATVGEADLYPRLGRTMEWDIAAGHAVLAAASGRVNDTDGVPLRYGKPDFTNPFFIASGFTE